jgi:hypothetical protein
VLFNDGGTPPSRLGLRLHLAQAVHAPGLRIDAANARHRDVLAAERRERARIRSEKGIRWGGRPLEAVA